MTWRIRLSLVLVAIATAFTLWCLVETTALSMTAFFSLGIPLYAVAAVFYVWELFRDLRQHRVL
jgi:predicted membrane channel-forming protein YqfA (hemolysin III family)